MEGQRSSLVASVFFTLVLTYCRGQGIPLSCPAIPIPIPEAIIEVHQCISMMSRPVKPSEMEVKFRSYKCYPCCIVGSLREVLARLGS